MGLLAADRPKAAERVLESGRSARSNTEVTVQDLYWLSADAFVGIYAGRALETWRSSAAHRKRFFGSFQGRMMAASMCGFIAGLAATAARDASDPSERRMLLREARSLAKRASKARPAGFIFTPHAVLLACLDGDRERAIAALRSQLEGLITPLGAHLLRRRLGVLLADAEGAELIAQADAWLRAGGVVDPERFTGAFSPGLELVESSFATVKS